MSEVKDFESVLRGRQYRRLLDVYGIPEDRRAGWLAEMGEAFRHYPVAAVVRATDAYVKAVTAPPGQYREVPTPADFSGWVYQAMEKLEREAERAALPPPAEKPEEPEKSEEKRTTGAERAAMLERHLGIGKLRARGNPLPDDQQIAAVIEEIRRTGFMRASLDRIREGRDVSPAEFVAEGGRRLRPIEGGRR